MVAEQISSRAGSWIRNGDHWSINAVDFVGCLGCARNPWSVESVCGNLPAFKQECDLLIGGSESDFYYAVGDVEVKGTFSATISEKDPRRVKLTMRASFTDLIDFSVNGGYLAGVAALVQAGFPPVYVDAGRTFFLDFPIEIDDTEFTLP